MAMAVKNNMSATKTLNTLNKNNTEMAKSLKKVSSGMKITGASDGASEYSISKRMDVLIRSLGQDIDNTKTGRNLVNTAEGGIQEIINLLRDMKEKALNSANDHNSDMDRATIQKDFAGRIDAIAEIAATTNYNGRLLLNGNYPEPCEKMVHVSIPQYNTKTITAGPPSVSFVPGANGTYTIIQNNSITDLMSKFSPIGSTAPAQSTPPDWYNTTYKPDAGLSYKYDYTKGNWSWDKAMGKTTGKNQTAVAADFSGVNLNGGTLPSALDNQGFTIICGGCKQYINFKFDANSTSSSLNRVSSTSQYTIGVQNVTSINDLGQAIFDGIRTIALNLRKGGYGGTGDTTDNLLLDGNHDVRMAKNPSGNGFVFLKDTSPAIGFISTGTVLGTTKDPGTWSPGTTTVTAPTTITITDITYIERDELQQIPGNPLIIHTGPKANQHLPVYINSMHPIALGINGVAVDSRRKAVGAIDMIDEALKYALNENTRMGAYQARLNETEENLVTEEENTTASMSTIQDADMAKEIANYTKHNVLTQTAQSALSQANQASSGVLNILQ